MPCRIRVNELWESKINGQTEGTFKITNIDPNGNFVGDFDNGGPQRIAGHCDQHGINFSRPANNPRFHYGGEFTGDDRAHGSRSDAFGDESVASEAKREAPPPDDWEGVKVTE